MLLIPFCVLFAFASATTPPLECQNPQTYYKTDVKRSECYEVRECVQPSSAYKTFEECESKRGLSDDDIGDLCEQGMKPYYSQSLKDPSQVTCVHTCLRNPPTPGSYYESEEACRKSNLSQEDIPVNGKCPNPKKGIYYRIMGQSCVGICFDGVPKDRQLYHETEEACQTKLSGGSLSEDETGELQAQQTKCLQEELTMYITWDPKIKMCTTMCLATRPEQVFQTMDECSKRQQAEQPVQPDLSNDETECSPGYTFYTYYDPQAVRCKTDCLRSRPLQVYPTMQVCTARHSAQPTDLSEDDPSQVPAQPQPPTQDCVHIYYVKGATGECVKECEGVFHKLNITESYETLADCQKEITRLMRLKVQQENPQPQQPRGVPQPQQPRGVPQPQQPRGVPQPQQPRGVPQPNQPRGVPQPQQPRGVPQPQQPRGVPQPQQPRGVPQPGHQQQLAGDIQDDFPFANPPQNQMCNPSFNGRQRLCYTYSCAGPQLQCRKELCDRQNGCIFQGLECPFNVPQKFKKLCKF